MHGSIVGGMLSGWTGGLVGATNNPQSLVAEANPATLTPALLSTGQDDMVGAPAVTSTSTSTDASDYKPDSPSKWSMTDAAKSAWSNAKQNLSNAGGAGSEGDKSGYQQLLDLRNGGATKRAIGDVYNGMSGKGWSF